MKSQKTIPFWDIYEHNCDTSVLERRFLRFWMSRIPNISSEAACKCWRHEKPTGSAKPWSSWLMNGCFDMPLPASLPKHCVSIVIPAFLPSPLTQNCPHPTATASQFPDDLL